MRRRCLTGAAPKAMMAPVLAAVLAQALLGCAGVEPAVPADAVARVGTTDVAYEEFSSYVERQLGEPGGALASDVLTGLLDRFLDERLLALDAVDRGLAEPEEPPAEAAVAAMAALADEDLGITDADVTAYYEAHRSEFRRPERVRLQQALFEERETAESARAEIIGGAEFGEVAGRLAQSSNGGGASPSTRRGELARDELPPAFAEVIFRLAPGEVSEVVEAEYGFHLFSVRERLSAAELPLAEARAEIESLLAREQADRRLAEMVESARRRYNVTVFERNLPFNYQGRYLAHSA